jgi:hypothetical protein
VDSLRAALDPFTDMCNSIDDELLLLGKDRSLKEGSMQVAYYMREYEVLKRLKMRLHLYCSYIIDISFVLASDTSSNSDLAMTSISSSLSKMDLQLQALQDLNVKSSILYHLKELAEALKQDVWQMAMERRFSSPESLCDELTYFIHGAYLRLTRHLRMLVLDRENPNNPKHSLLAENKRELLRSIIVEDNLFAEALQPALAAFELKFSRPPLLTHSLQFEELQHEMFALLTDEINLFLNNSLINTKLSARLEQSNDATTDQGVRGFMTPWSLERNRGVDLKISSSIPEDVQFQMNLQIESRVIFPLAQWGDRNISVIQACNFKVASAVAESYLKLADDYKDAIQQCCTDADTKLAEILRASVAAGTAGSETEDDRDSSQVNDIEDLVVEFLCSIVNDTDRIVNLHIPSCKQLLSRKTPTATGYGSSAESLGIPLLHEDVNLVFENATKRMQELASFAVSRIVTRFYSSLSSLYLEHIEESYSKSLADTATGISDLCGTIYEFAKYVRNDLLLPAFHSQFIKSLFNRLFYRYFLLVRDLRTPLFILNPGNQIANHLEDVTGYRPGFLLRKIITLPQNIVATAEERISQITHSNSPSTKSSATTSTSTAVRRTSGSYSLDRYMSDETAERLLQDAQVIYNSFSLVMGFAALDADEQMRLAEHYGIRLFVRMMQGASLAEDMAKSMTRIDFENQVASSFHKPLPAYPADPLVSKTSKLRAFLLDAHWQDRSSGNSEDLKADDRGRAKTREGLLYSLEVSHLECFNIRRAFNSFVVSKLR